MKSSKVVSSLFKSGARNFTPWGRVQLLVRLPRLARLSLALLRDPRVPMSRKVAAGGAIALVFSPLDVIQFVPIVGEISDLVLCMTILEQFIKHSPRDVVQEHIAKLGLQGKFDL